MKKIISILFFISSFGLLFAQNYKIQFVKGNLADKTSAVRNASGNEANWLSNEAINFVIENKELLGNDRDLEGLAVAAILSIQNDYVAKLSQDELEEYTDNFEQLFDDFSNSSTVQIAVLSKLTSLKNYIDTTQFTNLLNNYLQSTPAGDANPSVMKAVINSLSDIGNNISFSILYNCLNDRRCSKYYEDIENSIVSLIPVSMNEVLMIIHSNDLNQISKILNLIDKNSNFSQNSMSEIAENLLSQTILLIGNSSEVNNKVVDLQMRSLKILNNNKWTRASSTVSKFYSAAKTEYTNGIMSEEQYVEVIKSYGNIAPIEAVTPLIVTLGELNSQVEVNVPVSQNLALALIQTIGAIGDKSAFDTLLSVTYLNYPDEVLTAARTALSGLRW